MSSTAAESGTRSRTRRAILGAAARVLGRRHDATLADVARAAEVGRSTLHRYFPDREELVRAVVEDSLAVVTRALREARPEEGPAREAMHRTITAMVEHGDRLVFLWGDPRVLEDYGKGGPVDAHVGEDGLLGLIERGQREGAFDPALDPRWIQHVLWGLVYTGVEAGEQGLLPRHGVIATVIRTLENGVRPPAPG
ncbi:TetR/AcrR family transcriptional regulator [Spirillospora sp. NPDC127200]